MKPGNSEVLGDVLEHDRHKKYDCYVTKFSLIPDVKFLTWPRMVDESVSSWVVRPEKWYDDISSPPFVFFVTEYKQRDIMFTKVKVHPYSREIFEEEMTLK